MLENVCRNCFEKTTQTPCPHCGYNGEKNNDAAILPVGTILNGKYLLGKSLGRGGFGVTYLALDLNLEMKVCIKEYFPGDISTREVGGSSIIPYSNNTEASYDYGRKKFVEEGKTLAKFNSLDGTAVIFDFFFENNTNYIVMEYLDGMNLAEYLNSKPQRKLSLAETKTILEPVFEALIKIHTTGLIHRDIAPDNIFITKDAKVKLIDFGAARYALGEKSESLSVILKKGFAPPEQYSSKGKQGSWTDVYALAATTFRILTGQTPEEAVDRQMDNDEFVETLQLLPDGVRDTIAKAMVLKLKDRTQTVKEFKVMLFSVNAINNTNIVTQSETVYVRKSGNDSKNSDKVPNSKTSGKMDIVYKIYSILTVKRKLDPYERRGVIYVMVGMVIILVLKYFS